MIRSFQICETIQLSFQTRNDKINAASAELVSDRITPREFLQRVIFQNKMTDLNNFENVANYNIVEILKLDDGSDDEGDGDEASGGECATQQDKHCTICLTARLTVFFVKCRHRAACDRCYNDLLAIKKAEYDIMVANWYDDTDLDILQDDLPVPPHFEIACPICRCMQTEAQIVTGIYNDLQMQAISKKIHLHISRLKCDISSP